MKGGKQLIKLFAGTKSIQDIVEEYSDMLLRIAFQNLKSLKDAEDMVQETYIKLIKTDTSFDSEEHLKAWLIRVTINGCKDFFKTSWFKNTKLTNEEFNIFAPEEKGVLQELFSLKTQDRNIIYLYYYEGYSIKEIATMLDKKPNTVSSMLQRARKKLKIILLKEGMTNE